MQVTLKTNMANNSGGPSDLVAVLKPPQAIGQTRKMIEDVVIWEPISEIDAIKPATASARASWVKATINH